MGIDELREGAQEEIHCHDVCRSDSLGVKSARRRKPDLAKTVEQPVAEQLCVQTALAHAAVSRSAGGRPREARI